MSIGSEFQNLGRSSEKRPEGLAVKKTALADVLEKMFLFYIFLSLLISL